MKEKYTHTITKQVKIVGLTKNMDKCKPNATPYMQLEIYQYAEMPNKTIAAFNRHGSAFQYNIGDRVKVCDKFYVSQYCLLTNIIENKFFKKEFAR